MDIYRGKNGGGDAKAWLASMKADKRYLVDIWPKN
jgi:sulfite reductase alpha subunit-like flavoprotein